MSESAASNLNSISWEISGNNDRLCVVCEDTSSNYHFGQPTCSACAAFFRRSIRQNRNYVCKFKGKCGIHKANRNICRACRFKKCVEKGMDQMEKKQKNAQQQVNGNQQNDGISISTTLASANSPNIVYTPTNMLSSTPGSWTPQQPQMKYLSRMLEGYHQYSSLRKASYSMLNDQIYDGNNPPQSHIDNYRKMCKIAASIGFDIVDRFFEPFNSLEFSEKFKLFSQFFHPFCNANRCFKSHRSFGPGDDRFFMPDGGYLQLSKLYLYFENSQSVTGDPEQIAKIFHDSIQFLLNNVVEHMRKIEMQELELLALFGMFLWKEHDEIGGKTQELVEQTRNGIIVDLHVYYRSMGYSEEEVTLKTANLFLLIPKIEKAVKMTAENTTISEIFNMLTIEESCIGHVIV